MIVVPGDTPRDALAGTIADVMAIGMINSKTTGARLIPAPGKAAGDWVELGGLFGASPAMPLSTAGNSAFLAAAPHPRAAAEPEQLGGHDWGGGPGAKGARPAASSLLLCPRSSAVGAAQI